MSTKARHVRKSARHKKYRHELWKVKLTYKMYPQVSLEAMRRVAWWLSEPTPKGWKKYTFRTGIIFTAEEMLPIFNNLVVYEPGE